ncbi:unnamed protein product [Ceutorhynchus assimilis]|uniref:Major facilitator superfamily (MFS) profile domain-containing protein n=1 Tax=Ceutorhynchus assimilis TaxID=467358 RepID=A0A9N9QNA1_9CUCU|nr:unnamed protein product [Ceutorhynchus assimilis]
MDSNKAPTQSQLSMNSIANVEIKVTKYRWTILFIIGLVSIMNFMQMLQFSIIANIITKFYNVESYWVDMTTLIFFLSYILFFYPVSYLIEKYNLKWTVVVATALTLAGSILKIFAPKSDLFWLILLAQFLIAIGQVQLSSLPSKLATTWFGCEEVSTACAIVVLGMQLGSGLGCIQSPFLITGTDNDTISLELYNMFLYQAIATGCIFVLVLIFFRSKPQLPPSQSQLDLLSNTEVENVSFYTNMKKIVKEKNFWFIVLSLGLANGVWNSFGVLVNTIYLNYFPDGQSDAGIISLVTIISGGCIGSMIFGYLLDKTHEFKKISFAILTLSALFYFLMSVTLIEKSRIGSFIVIPFFGFFIAPVLIVAFEYLVEVTYPIPEACSSSIFNAAYFLLSIIVTLLVELLISAIDYLWTFVCIFLTLCLCVMFILLVDSNLKRRDANLQHNNSNNVMSRL